MKQLKSDNEGSAILTVLIVAMIGAISCLATLQISNISIKQSGHKKTNTLLLNIAEAGEEHALAMLRSGNIELSADTSFTAIPLTDFGGGTYEVQCIANSLLDTAWLLSEARLKSKCRKVEILIAISNIASPVWNYAFYSDGSITLNGNGTIYGSVHTNSSFTCTGNLRFNDNSNPCDIHSSGNMRITGNVMASGDLYAPDITITGNNNGGVNLHEESVPNIALPDIDFDSYYQIALSNGWVLPGGSYNGINNWTDVPGGVIWFDGNLSVAGITTVNAIIIATGDVSINGNFNQHRSSEGLGGIVSRDGELQLRGNVQSAEGLIYSEGDLTFSGNGDVNGQVICGGNATISGNYGVLDYSRSQLQENGGTPQYEVMAWRETMCN